MAVFPVVCQRCNLFQIRNTPLLGNASARVSFETMRFENACPNCGGDLYGLTGEYDVVNGVARFIEGPAESEEQFRRFLELVDEAIADQLTAEEFVQRVHQEVPEFSSHFQMDFDRLMDILKLFLMLVVPSAFHYYGIQQDEQQHEELMQQQQEHHEEMMEQASRRANDLNENDVHQIVNQFLEEMDDSSDDDNTEGNGSTGEGPPEANNSQ